MSKKYEVKIMKFGDMKNVVKIPKFQRSPVWNKDKKRELINSIKKDLPIGCLLLSKQSNNTYLVVDGLQRFSTLIDFEKNRFNYVSEDDIDEEEIKKIIACDHQDIFNSFEKRAKDINLEKIKDEVAAAFKDNTKTLNDLSWDLTGNLQKNIAFLSNVSEKELQSSCFNLITKIDKMLDINEVEIPVIVFNNTKESDNSDLIDIFTKLNSEGVKLSKYDIFSANWQGFEVDIGKDMSMIEKVIKKYVYSEEQSGLDIDGFDPDEIKETGKVNLFEYAYAISKVLSQETKYIYKAADESKVDSLGFTLLAGIFNVKNNKMKDLKKELEKYSNIDFVELKNRIIDCAKIVEESLVKFIVGFDSKNYSSHSELQLASYILVLFKLKYCVNPDGGLIKNPNNNKDLIANFKMFLYKHYLYDILRGYWAGSGDSKLDNIISDPKECAYLSDVNKENFENVIISWLDNNNSKTIENIPTETKLFLNYIHRMSFSEYEKKDKFFDFDHIIPKQVLKDNFKSKGINCSISSPCNLCIIQAFDNRSKGKLTYYQYTQRKPEALKIDQETLDKCVYPHPEEINFIESKDSFTIENYNHFLNERKEILTKTIINKLYKL